MISASPSTSPAIVSQLAVRRLPRVALVLFCAAYVLPGWFGREPWKSADMAAFGYMLAMAQGATHWLAPQLAGLSPEQPGLLALWLGALSIRLFTWLPPDFAVRIPFAVLLAATLAQTWYAAYFLARNLSAQPVGFAFGGEAQPIDYARAVADGALLALIASLGLAQLAHQTTMDVVQLWACSAMLLFGAALHRSRWSLLGLFTSTLALIVSGAPVLAACLLLTVVTCRYSWVRSQPHAMRLTWLVTGTALAVTGATAVASLGLWQSSFTVPQSVTDVRNLMRLWAWFAWPTSVLAAWAIWRWRAHFRSEHLLLPLCFITVLLPATAFSHNADRLMLLALPALAVLAAFALPTASRSIAALVDWFTLLFFSGCAICIWVVWLAMQTGLPGQIAANVARLAPGFAPSFGPLPLVVALAATLWWAWLVKWRVGRNRHAMWKSMVLPAGGAAMCWLLLMTLWMPLLDFARSYAPLMRMLSSQMTLQGCVETHGLTRAQTAALQFYTNHRVAPLHTAQAAASVLAHACPYLVIDADVQNNPKLARNTIGWSLKSTLRRPADDDENLLLYERAAQ